MVELLVVVLIISILVTAASMGIGAGGKGVTSGVATAEALFDEARAMAISMSTKTRVMILKDPPDTAANFSNSLRRIVLAYGEARIDPVTGELETDPVTGEPMYNWILSGRGTLLPEQVYFSETFSQKEHSVGGVIEEFEPDDWTDNYAGTYFYYEFNSQGICSTPGASFIIGKGSRSSTKSAEDQPPRVTASAKRDFGGFVVWRNGKTSVFRNNEQMGTNAVESGDTF